MKIIKYFILMIFVFQIFAIICSATECNGIAVQNNVSEEYLGKSLSIEWCVPDDIIVDGKISPTYAFFKANKEIFELDKYKFILKITERELLEADRIFREKAEEISKKLSVFTKIEFVVINGSDEKGDTYAFARGTWYDNVMKTLLGKNAYNIITDKRVGKTYDAILDGSSTKASEYILNDTLFILKYERDKKAFEDFGVKAVVLYENIPSPKNIISLAEQVEQYADNLLKEHRKNQMGEVLKDYFKNPMNTMAFFEIQESLRNSFRHFGYSGKLI
jgi:hypothetical protein